MKTASVSAFIDKYHPPKDGNCPVSIRITFQRKRRYYSTGIALPAIDFERVMTAKRRSETDKTTYKKILDFIAKANGVIGKLPVFTFGQFEAMYLENREAADGIAYGFDLYVKELRGEKRIGTAVSYETAKNSLESFHKGLKYADITRPLLIKYENWMIDQGKSKTTIGIYLRSLRTIFNRAAIDKSLYPFGEGKGKYSIPTGRNIKKALALDEIAKIFNYESEPGSVAERSRDYWIFIYLCNGLNMKDLCLLRRKDIRDNILTYERAKTKRSKKESDKIVVSLKPEAKVIIAKWGQLSIAPEAYLFPHIRKGMSAEDERKTIQQLVKVTNKYMKRIAADLGISKDVTTYFARHSFATVLKRSGVSTEFISEALGHSNLKTTQSYLAGFEEDTIHKTTDALTAFKSVS